MQLPWGLVFFNRQTNPEDLAMTVLKNWKRNVFVKILIFAGLLFCGECFAVSVPNPIIWADVPDVSMLRVEDSFYMVSTTMHVAPGVPIMASRDLSRWRTVGYAYRTLADNDQQNLNAGKHAYGKGSWASSIRYHDGFYYVLTPSYTTGKTHLYKTRDLTGDDWEETLLPFYHDPSLFFDDDGTVWVFYGNSPVSYVQLNEDAGGVKAFGKSGTLSGTEIEPVAGADYIVKQEGAHMEKVNGEYYLFTISWPAGKCRTSVVYRSKNLLGGYSGRIFLQDGGVAQGSIFDTPDGKWYAMLFRDSGPVGRVPYLVPTHWENGWPVADGGKASAFVELENGSEPGYGMVTSDDFNSETLRPEWQWNHNPDNSNWKISDGKLWITSGRVDGKLYFAKNTMTQRTFGPKCSARILVRGKGLNNGDIAGVVALQDSMGYAGIVKSGDGYSVAYYKERSDGKHLIKSENIDGDSVYLRVDFDLPLDRGTAIFYYSTDGKIWTEFSDRLNLHYTLGMFTGYRIGLFNMATEKSGGTAAFDWYKIGTDVEDEICLYSEVPVPQTPHNATSTPWPIPGKIQMEDFDDPGIGTENSSYRENDAENHGDSDYRKGTGVDLYLKNGGIVVGYNQSGEWLEYTVDVAQSGEYTLFAAVASANNTSGFIFSMDGEAITDTLAVPPAESFDNYDDYNKVKANVRLREGTHILRFTVTGDWMDIDYVNFVFGKDAVDDFPISGKESAALPISTERKIAGKSFGTFDVFSLTGKFLTRMEVDVDDVSVLFKKLGFSKGVYFVRKVGDTRMFRFRSE